MGDSSVDAFENDPNNIENIQTPLETAIGINSIDIPEVTGDDQFITYQEPEPTYTAPAPAPAPGPVYYDYSSGDSGDSGQSDSQSGADSAQEDDSAGYGGY